MRIPSAFTLVLVLAITALSGCFGGSGKGALSADFVVTPLEEGGVKFQFDASNSSGKVAEYIWNFGDGDIQRFSGDTLGDGKIVEKEYAFTDTTLHMALTIFDKDGNGAALENILTLGTGSNMAPEAHIAKVNRWVQPGEIVMFDAADTDDHDGDDLTREWFFGPFVDPMPPEFMTDSGEMETGDTFEQLFDTPGVYYIHCHPHPWMKSRILVKADAEEAGNATVHINGYSFNNGTELVVPPGTVVNFVNEDPVTHTATSEYSAPGTSGGTASMLHLTNVAPGDYQAWLFLDDGKGGFGGTSWGVRVSDDAPAQVNVSESGGVTAAGEEITVSLEPLEFAHNITATLQYTAGPGSGATVDLAFETTAGVAPPGGNKTCSTSPCELSLDAEPGEYQFRILINGGLTDQVTNYALEAVLLPYADPGFGDSAAGDDPHAHH